MRNRTILLAIALIAVSSCNYVEVSFDSYADLSNADGTRKIALPSFRPLDLKNLKAIVNTDNGRVWGRFESDATSSQVTGGVPGEWDHLDLWKTSHIGWWPSGLVEETTKQTRTEYDLVIVENKYTRETYAFSKSKALVFYWEKRLR